MRSIFLILVMAASCFSAYEINRASGRFRDSIKVDSLRNSVGIGTDAAGKFIKSDSVRASHKSDHADSSDSSRVSKYSHRGITQAGTSADTILVARRASDSTWRTLTRIQARAAVGAVDSNRIFCDTPFVPYSTQSGTSKTYQESPMRVIDGYVDLPSTDTSFTAFGATDDNYSNMCRDTNGNVYAITGTGEFYRRLSTGGAFANLGVTDRGYTDVCIKKSTNEIFAATYRSSNGYGKIYKFDGSDFVIYDSVAGACGSFPTRITITDSDDMIAALCGNIYKQTGGSGAFNLIDNLNSNGFLSSYNDTVFYTAVNVAIHFLIPGAAEFVEYSTAVKPWQGTWFDDDGNMYACAINSGIYIRLSGTTYFSKMFYGGIYSWSGGTYSDRTIYACGANSEDGDIYTKEDSTSFLDTKLNVVGVTHQRGDLILYSADSSGSNSVLTLNDDNTVGSRAVSGLTSPHNVTPGQIPMSNGATTFRNTGTTVDSTTGDIHVYGKIIVGDTAYTSVPGMVEGHGNQTDVNRDSLMTCFAAAPAGDKRRGGAFRTFGNEAPLSKGNATMIAGDSGQAIIEGNDINIHVFHPSDTSSLGVPVSKIDVRIGRDVALPDDTNRVAIYLGRDIDSSSGRIFGGRGLSSTMATIALGNSISNRVTISADTTRVSDRLEAPLAVSIISEIDTARIGSVSIGIGGSAITDIHRRTDTLVIKFSATDSLCFKAVAP